MPFSVTLKIRYFLQESGFYLSFVACVCCFPAFIECYFQVDDYFTENSLPNFYQQTSVKVILIWSMLASWYEKTHIRLLWWENSIAWKWLKMQCSPWTWGLLGNLQGVLYIHRKVLHHRSCWCRLFSVLTKETLRTTALSSCDKETLSLSTPKEETRQSNTHIDQNI